MTEEKKENQKSVNLIIISDSVGDTAFNMVQAGAVQYPDVKFNRSEEHTSELQSQR